MESSVTVTCCDSQTCHCVSAGNVLLRAFVYPKWNNSLTIRMLLHSMDVGERRHRVARTERVDEVRIHELLVKNLDHEVEAEEQNLALEPLLCWHREWPTKLEHTNIHHAYRKNSWRDTEGPHNCKISRASITQARVARALLSIATVVQRVGARHMVGVFAHLVEISGRERSGECENEPGRHREPIFAMLDGVEVSRVCESSKAGKLHRLRFGDRACCGAEIEGARTSGMGAAAPATRRHGRRSPYQHTNTSTILCFVKGKQESRHEREETPPLFTSAS